MALNGHRTVQAAEQPDVLRVKVSRLYLTGSVQCRRVPTAFASPRGMGREVASIPPPLPVSTRASLRPPLRCRLGRSPCPALFPLSKRLRLLQGFLSHLMTVFVFVIDARETPTTLKLMLRFTSSPVLHQMRRKIPLCLWG